MKGTYIKPDGEKVEVIDFDEINKMAHVKFERGKPEYYHENEYSLWTKEGEISVEQTESEIVTEELLPKEQIDAEVKEEPKKKRVYKKKDK